MSDCTEIKNIFDIGEFVQKISEKISTEWKRLGRYLGVDEEILEEIEDESRKAPDRAFKMIKAWKQKNSKPTIQQLYNKFKEMNRLDLIKVVEKIAETFENQVNGPAPNSIQGIEKYIFNSNPCGICVIINNNFCNYENSYAERMGTQLDVQSLKETFQMLNFKVELHEDKTKSEMAAIIKECGNEVDVDCLVCCILSHGHLEAVHGTDGIPLTFKEMRSAINDNSANLLKGKPKIFFIQACQGNDFLKEYLEADSCPNQRNSSRVLHDADFIFSVATTPGNYAWRSPNKGSHYIQTLCKLLKNDQSELSDILKKLNNEMREIRGEIKNADGTTGTTLNLSNVVFYTLNKDIYFERAA